MTNVERILAIHKIVTLRFLRLPPLLSYPHPNDLVDFLIKGECVINRDPFFQDGMRMIVKISDRLFFFGKEQGIPLVMGFFDFKAMVGF